jgi:hypothetical protein
MSHTPDVLEAIFGKDAVMAQALDSTSGSSCCAMQRSKAATNR